LDPLLSLVLELEDLDGWEWNRMPIPLEEGKVVRSGAVQWQSATSMRMASPIF
jgi:hypothetical protein